MGNNFTKIKILVLALLITCFLTGSISAEPAAPAPTPDKITIAVYPIKMAGADKALTEPLTQILIREISRSPRIRVVEETMIAEVLKKQGFANSDLCDNSQCQISIGKLTPAQKLVTPELSKLGKKFILDLIVTDIQSGVVDFVASSEKVCTEDDLDQLAAAAALELRAKFGEKVELPRPTSPTGNSISAPSQPPSDQSATRNILGIVVADELTPAQKRTYAGGIKVKSVAPDSPCKKVLAPGNIISHLDPEGTMTKKPPAQDDNIRNMNDFLTRLPALKPGASVGLLVFQGGGLVDLGSIVHCDIPSQPPANSQTAAPVPSPSPAPSPNAQERARVH